MKSRLEQPRERAGLVFWLALLTAAALFLPFLVMDRGYFIYYGDFNVQQIPFYSMAHDAVRSGDIFWNWTTDLGANFIGSYSFYLLGSPFFWLTLAFPGNVVPYLMAPLLMLKMAFAALAAYGFLRRFVRSDTAVVGSLLYAFSGFSIYNIFFNHFHEALIFFPLMLLALEQLMTENRRGVFALTVFASALSNYYFLIGQAVFLVLYWLCRSRSGDWDKKISRLLGALWEALLGAAMAGVLLLPSFFAVLQNPRVESHLSGWGLLIYNKPQRFFDILHSFFFPQDIPARPNFFPDADNKWSSMSAWLPVFGCTGALAYYQSRPSADWLRRLLFCLTLFAFVPGLNSLFQLGNAMYYARWFYMLVLMLALATVKALDEEDLQPVNWRRAFGWSVGISAAIALFVGLAPAEWGPDEETGAWHFGLYEYIDRFLIYVVIVAVSLAMAAVLVSLFRRERTLFLRWTAGVTVGVVLVFGWYHLALGKFQGRFTSDYLLNNALERPDFDLPDTDTENWRIDVCNDLDNLGMFWRWPSIQAFHSIVPGSVMDFYSSVNVDRSVASRPDTSHYALRSLLSVRWLFDYQNTDGTQYKDEESYFSRSDETTGEPTLSMPGWSYYDTQYDYAIYENDNYIPMGFTYTDYLLRSEYDAMSPLSREAVMLKALVVNDEEEDRVSSVLHHLTAEKSLYSQRFTSAAFAEDCAARNTCTADTFVRDTRGFTAAITLPQETPVFFSVPCEAGWSATVNGEPVDILTANVGFMAVMCPAGDVTIRFTYTTPGLWWGAVISIGAVLLLALYYLLFRLTHRQPPAAEPPAPTDPSATGVFSDFNLYDMFPADDPPPADS